jgi:hypothetical protein
LRHGKLFIALCFLAASTAQGSDSPAVPRILCNGVFKGFPSALNFTGVNSCTGIGGVNVVTVDLSPNSGATTTATYITQTPDAALSAEQAMSLLGTGLVKNTTATGVQSIYTGTSCSYAIQALNASGAASTCRAAPTDISGAHYITTQAEANLSAEAVVPTCTGTKKLTFDGSSLSCLIDELAVPGGSEGTLQVHGPGEVFLGYFGSGCGVGEYMNSLDPNGVAACNTLPTNLSAEPFITKTASANLSNEFALGSLATGLLKNTTVTGIPTIAASGTDYAPATSGSVLLLGNGAGGFSNYAGATSCTNQFFTGLSTTGASTCTTDTLASAQHANQGTTTQVLHGNAAGNPSWSGVALADHVANLGTTTTVLHGNAAGQPSYGAVTLTTDVTGVLPLANGGTNKNNTAANGAVVYSDATTFLPSAVGTLAQGLYSGGAGAPTWVDAPKVVRLTADYTNATTTLSNTALTWTSPAVVSRSAFDCMLMVKSSATTTGGQFDVLNGTAPTTITYELQYVTAAGTAPSTGGTKVFVTSVAGSTLLGPAATSLTTNTLWRLTGIIVHTSTASAVTIRGKAGAAGTLTVASGSFCS